MRQEAEQPRPASAGRFVRGAAPNLVPLLATCDNPRKWKPMSPIPTQQDPPEELDTKNADPASLQTSVLVVGAGPTGLLLASELQRRGVPCHVIDARPGPNHWDRATVIHPRSLQIFESLGLVEKLLDAGCRQRVVKIHSGGKELGTIDLATCGSIYGFNLGVSEEVTESILTEYLHQQGGKVNQSSRLVGLMQHDDRVLAEIEHHGGRYQINARWVVGCDGIHSATRELSGIGFEGHDIVKEWAVFDATVQGWTDTYEGIFAYHDTLPIILTALPGQRWRVYLRPSSDSLRPRRRCNFDSPHLCTHRIVRQCREPDTIPLLHQDRHQVPIRLSLSGRRLRAPLLSRRRTRMNCGIQEAFNLAWKLALVHHGAADPTLLDSYEAERRPIAEMFTQSGDEFEHAQLMTDPTERDARDQAIKAMLANPDDLHHRSWPKPN